MSLNLNSNSNPGEPVLGALGALGVETLFPAHAVMLATHAMGTRFELVLADADAPRGEWHAIAESALSVVEDCHRRLSRFATDSLVSHIARTAHERPVRLDADTCSLLEDALTVWRESGGAFDITVGPALDGATFVSGMAGITLDRARATIRAAAPIALDLGGIAKGHALDLAARELRAHGVTSALLHGGTSSVIAIGTPPGEAGWRVALGPEEGAPLIALRDAALSVSSTLDRPAHAARAMHVVAPATGRRLDAVRTVAVTGPSARLADAWSTALLVLGERPPSLDVEWTTWMLP